MRRFLVILVASITGTVSCFGAVNPDSLKSEAKLNALNCISTYETFISSKKVEDLIDAINYGSSAKTIFKILQQNFAEYLPPEEEMKSILRALDVLIDRDAKTYVKSPELIRDGQKAAVLKTFLTIFRIKIEKI